MSKFVKSSIWNLCANIFVRALSLVTYPFLVRYFLKSDISIFKSFQSFIVILIAIIPLGTKHLYISSPKDRKKERWNLAFYVSSFFAFFLIILLSLNSKFLSFFLKDVTLQHNYIFIFILVFLATIKTLAITRLSSNMQFKEISIALMVKQIVLYSIIITSSFKLPTLTILFLALFITEVIETCMLLIFMKVSKIQFLPSFGAKVFSIDKVSQKFIFFIGFEQIFNVLAQQFPAIFVVFVMGKNLAPEFQLPLYAVSIPASLIMVSVAKVIFPYISEIRDNEKIKTMLISLEFIITLIILPILIGISFFSKEIVAILFDKSWTNAVIAFRFLPIMIIANVLNNPFTSIAAVKEKPHIIFIYSISLFLCRMLSIFVGYKLLGFKGAILLFVFFDFFIRMIRLKIDTSLVKLKFSKFLLNLKNNFLAAAILFSVSILLFSTFQNKLVSFIVGFIFYVFLSFKLEKERIAELVYKLKENISIKR